MRLSGKVALVTGAGGGIGRAIARRLLQEGASIALNDSDLARNNETSKVIASESDLVYPIQADISNEADVIRLISETILHFGRLDILVNNAGIDLASTIENMTVADWKRMQSVDLEGAFLCTKYAQPHLVDSKSGVIVNISSIHAVCTQPERAAYAAAKAGLVGLTRALALELGPKGIRVNAVLPGYIRTEIWNIWLQSIPNPDDLVARIAQQHPLLRIGTPDDVAATVAFLASDDASFISGIALVVDGGLTAMFPPPPLC